MSSKLRKKSRSRYNAETPNDWIIERVTVEICVILDQTLVLCFSFIGGGILLQRLDF